MWLSFVDGVHYCFSFLIYNTVGFPVWVVLQLSFWGPFIDCHQSERVSAIKPGLTHHFLHLKMSIPSQEYYSSYLFVFDAFCFFVFFLFCHVIMDFPNWFSSKLSTFVILLVIACCSVWAKRQYFKGFVMIYFFTNYDLDGELPHWHSYCVFLYLLIIRYSSMILNQKELIQTSLYYCTCNSWLNVSVIIYFWLHTHCQYLDVMSLVKSSNHSGKKAILNCFTRNISFVILLRFSFKYQILEYE